MLVPTEECHFIIRRRFVSVILSILLVASMSAARGQSMDAGPSAIPENAQVDDASERLACSSNDKSVEVFLLRVGTVLRYRCVREGQTLWTQEFGFEFEHCAVSPSGKLIGAAYLVAPLLEAQQGSRKSSAVVATVIVGSDGEIKLFEAHDRAPSSRRTNPTSPYLPTVKGISLHPGVAIVRFLEQDAPHRMRWYAYDFEQDRRAYSVTPTQPEFGDDSTFAEISAESLIDTDLIVLQWWVFHQLGPREVSQDCRLSVLNARGEQLWYMHYRGEYDGVAPNFPRLLELLRERPQLIVNGKTFGFTHWGEENTTERYELIREVEDGQSFFVVKKR